VTCGHCGYEHPEGTVACPKTNERMNVPGLIGTRVDRYEVLKLLGVGGFGSVYRAKHVHTDSEVALKVLKRALNADQAMLDRFLREAKAAAAVGSEHIVRVLDAGVASDGTAFLAMELLDGWDLKELLTREGPLSSPRLLSIMTQVLEGLSAAHAKGIVHRVIKPGNVFVVRKGEQDFVKLLDFGISKMHQQGEQAGLTMTGVAMGTPAYMAPEQFFDARNVDGRADLYSVAAMLYELLGRKLPFDAESYAELIIKVRTETPRPLLTLAPQLPPPLAAAVEKGLARDKAARWTSAREFSAALVSVSLPAAPPRSVMTPMPAPSPARDPLEASLMFGQTVTPMPAKDSGWVAPMTAQPPPAQPTPQMLARQTPLATTPQPQPLPTQPTPQMLARQTPLAAAPQMQPSQQPQKGNTAKMFLIAICIVGGLTVICCLGSALINALQAHH
jgi:serine/threonine protein kinase